MENITFVTLAAPGISIIKAMMMAHSLRSFGGELRDNPVWILVPEEMTGFPEPLQGDLKRHNVMTVPFKLPSDLSRFPFAAKISAAAHAEANLHNETGLLVWLDCDNIILRQPDEFRLPAGKFLGYRPVHHRLVGQSWGTPPDPFWELIYRSCGVRQDRQFPMTTHTGEVIAPYFNAGSFVIRPESNLMARWQDAFEAFFLQPEFQAFYQADNRYRIFMHQAVLTGVLLHELEPVEMVELSPKINYPLHLHHEIPPEMRPSDLHELTTIRYENLFEVPGWQERLPLLQPLFAWLEAQPLFQNKFAAGE